MDSIGTAYGTAPASVFHGGGPDRQFQPRPPVVSRLAALAEPANPEAGTSARATPLGSAGAQGGAHRRGPAATGPGGGDPGGRGRRQAPAQGFRPGARRATGRRRDSHDRALRAAHGLEALPASLSDRGADGT